jgi:hypothetical protein
MGITKKQLKRTVEKINKLITNTDKENVLNIIVEFFQQVKFLGDNRGKIHADMPRKGRILWLFVPNETEEKVFAFIRLFREIEEIQNLKIKTIGGIVEKSSILYKKETLAQIEASGDSKKINDTKEFLLQLIKSYEGKFNLDWLW